MAKNINYSINDKVITVNQNRIEFDYYITNVVQINNILIVRLSLKYGQPMRNDVPINNIYGINADGEIIWQVEDTMELLPVSMEKPYYTGMRPAIAITEFSGSRFLIDIENGKVIENLFTTK